jgi:Holliday junction resolvase
LSGRSSRNKGANAEREVANIIKERMGIHMHRTPLSGGMQWKGDIQGWPGYHLEVKRCEKLSLPAWLRQTEADCPTGSVPLLVYRSSREPWRVVIQLDDLLNIIKGEANA